MDASHSMKPLAPDLDCPCASNLAGETAVQVGDVAILVDPGLVTLAHTAVGFLGVVAASDEVLPLVLDAGLIQGSMVRPKELENAKERAVKTYQAAHDASNLDMQSIPAR